MYNIKVPIFHSIIYLMILQYIHWVCTRVNYFCILHEFYTLHKNNLIVRFNGITHEDSKHYVPSNYIVRRRIIDLHFVHPSKNKVFCIKYQDKLFKRCPDSIKYCILRLVFVIASGNLSIHLWSATHSYRGFNLRIYVIHIPTVLWLGVQVSVPWIDLWVWLVCM